MRKHNFLRSALCLIMALVCNVAWAEKIQPSTTFPDKGVPEHVYTMMNGNGVYANGLTAPHADRSQLWSVCILCRRRR